MYIPSLVPKDASPHSRSALYGTVGGLLHRYADGQPSAHPPRYFYVIRLVLRRNEAVSHQEIDQDETAIWLEFKLVQRVDDLGYRPKLVTTSVREK